MNPDIKVSEAIQYPASDTAMRSTPEAYDYTSPKGSLKLVCLVDRRKISPDWEIYRWDPKYLQYVFVGICDTRGQAEARIEEMLA